MSESQESAASLTLLGADPALAGLAEAWLQRLASERQLSPLTIEAYRRDLRQFTGFLVVHAGATVTAEAWAALRPDDVRAFMAHRRRNDVGSRSLMRALAGLRSFARHLEREGHGKAGVFAAVRSPKLARALPKPVPWRPRAPWCQEPLSPMGRRPSPGSRRAMRRCCRSSTAPACASPKRSG